MKQILNGLFYFIKFLLFFAALSLSIFIISQMYSRLGKDIKESVKAFAPFFVIFVLFIINILLKQKNVTHNLFYNITCCLAFGTIVVVGLRALFDTNLILWEKLGRKINFNFFDYFIPFMKIMLYGLSIANFFLMFNGQGRRKKKEKIATKVEDIEQVI